MTRQINASRAALIGELSYVWNGLINSGLWLQQLFDLCCHIINACEIIRRIPGRPHQHIAVLHYDRSTLIEIQPGVWRLGRASGEQQYYR